MLTYRPQRYRVTLGPKRTTVTLDSTLSILLSLHLGHTPETPQAQQAVRRWLQARIDQSGDYGRCLVSQWLQHEVMVALIPRELDAQYGDWLCRPLDTIVSTVAPRPDALAAAAEVVKQVLASIPKTR